MKMSSYAENLKSASSKIVFWTQNKTGGQLIIN